MIIKNFKKTELIYFKNKIIGTVYKGTIKMWELISSCFGKGFWVNDKKWNNNEGWKN